VVEKLSEKASADDVEDFVEKLADEVSPVEGGEDGESVEEMRKRRVRQLRNLGITVDG